MIQVTATAAGGLHELRVEGRGAGGGAAAAGCDGIVYGLLRKLEGLGGHVRYHAHEAERGSLWVCAEGDEQVEAAFLLAAAGLAQVEKAHPELVHVVRLKR